jgi:hypothetical protein
MCHYKETYFEMSKIDYIKETNGFHRNIKDHHDWYICEDTLKNWLRLFIVYELIFNVWFLWSVCLLYIKTNLNIVIFKKSK